MAENEEKNTKELALTKDKAYSSIIDYAKDLSCSPIVKSKDRKSVV